MTETRRRLDLLLDAALDLPTEALPEFLNERCPPRLRERLAALLEVRDEGVEAPSPISEKLFQELAWRLAEFSPTLAEGDRLGPWRVGRELGRGGMGIVYLAERIGEGTPRKAALKVARMPGDVMAEHFRHEREILASVAHRNIVRLLDHGTTEDARPYLVLDLVEGQPLDAYSDERRLDLKERLSLFLSVARAVEAAHHRRVVHRDLKPSNILVAAGGRVQLLDFGIAKLADTRSGAAVSRVEAMTPDYASPEQFLGRPVTTATDVYQLGMLLYLLLTGQRAYDLHHQTPQEALKVVCEKAPRKPSELFDSPWVEGAAERSRNRSASVLRLRRDLEGELDAIVLKALDKDPERRYRSVADFRGDVERYLGGPRLTLGRAA